ncbi:MAG: hypothetical protein FD143_1624 [Ignavibacteria bacterium]|nr:MAG: hypothetical protein FD143_1624 [Ignavibacteria bacterium]KAF0161812.1 MAG: hypothetical protein FD188_617 [Ignavibacteria bacterium]
MSWLMGVAGNFPDGLKKQINNVSENILVKQEENNLIIIAGGIRQTCKFNIETNEKDSFISVGVGIEHSENDVKFMNEERWQVIDNVEKARKLEGHFVKVRWNKDEIKVYTDILGLRDIFYATPQKDYIIFSTRGDWLAKYLQAEINFKEFGSRWLLFNQLSSNSILNGVERLSGGSSIRVNRNDMKVTINKYDWLPNLESDSLSSTEYSTKLEKLINIPFIQNQRVSLSFSGGMDSRLILSYLAGRRNNWYTHTFGDYNHPDSVVANSIAKSLSIEHEQINLDMPTQEVFLTEFKDYLLLTNVNNAVSGYLQLRNYKKLICREEVIIDGGFGEIWRREFFNRLLLRGRKELLEKNIGGIIPYLIVHRADVFTGEIKNIFNTGCKEQLENIFINLPDANTIGMENWIDLFAIKTRLLNYYSSAQVHLDNWVFGYMPFIQKSLLENLFVLSVAERKNGKLFRYIIKRNNKMLSKFPLAKGQFTHPFFLNTIQSHIWNIAYKKLRLKTYNDTTAENLLNALSTYIQDTVSTKDVKECGCYDHSKLLRLSNNFAKGTASSFDLYELDWWFAFELFRQGIIK